MRTPRPRSDHEPSAALGSSASDAALVRRVFLILSLTGLFLVLVGLIVAVPQVPFLLFASVLGAIGLSSLADHAHRRLRVPRKLAVLGISVAILVAVAGLFWLAAPRLAQQVANLADRLPAAAERVRSFLGESWAGSLLEDLDRVSLDAESVSSLVSGVFRPLANALGVTLSAISATVVWAVMAVFIALEPQAYVDPALRLVRPARRERIGEILGATAHALRSWLVGRLVSMGAISALTLLGLTFLGVSEALLLSVLAGLLSFVPYLGPALSVVPAIIASLGDGGTSTLGVLALYAGVQVIEGNVLTPVIERRAVSIPAAAIIAAQLLLGVPFGFVGLLLATPLAVCGIVAVQGLYLEDVLGEDVRYLAESDSSASEQGPEHSPCAPPTEDPRER